MCCYDKMLVNVERHVIPGYVCVCVCVCVCVVCVCVCVYGVCGALAGSKILS
jgi:hypothetical protein